MLGIRAWEYVPTLRVANLRPSGCLSGLLRCFKVALVAQAEEPADAIHSCAAELLHGEQLSYARSMCFLFSVVTSGVSLLRNSLMYQDDATLFHFSKGQHAVLCIAAAAFALVYTLMTCNVLWTSKVAEKVYVSAFLFIDAMIVFSSDYRYDVEQTSRIGLVLGFVFLFARVDTRLVAFSNVVFTILAGVRHTIAEAATDRGEMSTVQFVASVMFIVAWQTFASHQFYTCSWDSALKEARVKEGSAEQGALSKLLESACEVVASLDASFSFSDDAKLFSSMLMRDSSRSLRGQSIFDYIANEEDRERLQKSFMAKSTSVEPRVAALNLHLLDGLGSKVNFEAMGVAFRQVDGTERYRIGLRELPDFLPRSIRELQRRTLAPAEVAQEEVIGNRRSNHPGTPATIFRQPIPDDAQDLNELDASRSTSRARRSCNVQHLVAPLWNETTEEGRLQSLLKLMESWNCMVPAGCCSMHRTIPEVKRMIKSISKMTCKHAFHEPRDQCTSCGLLGSYEEDLICSNCHHDESVCL
eukprot:TRINITY_DN19572_c0_g1_i1.p1 TRINITY_DN19572_c0_g1~~TRINITY_DN19572_c0_g1_i1.p1  ORF type:complete len:572 (+),score=43.21 TRINITY_DN19572_c0_g1_i1:135-1718(+)